MRSFLIVLFHIFASSLLAAQEIPGDSILANERAIDRPITLHAGQARVTGVYGLSFLNRHYNIYSESTSLRAEGLSSTRHRSVFDVKFGLNDFIQLNAAMAYSANVVNEETQYIFPVGTEPTVSHDVQRIYSGFEDLFLGVDLRAPLKTRKFDIAIKLGATLPVARFEPPQPDHSFENTVEDGAALRKFAYRYRHPRGNGVVIARIGAMSKYRTTRFAFSAGIDYQHALKDGRSFEWRHQLNSDGAFEYRKDPFTYRLPDIFQYFAEVEYQARPRLDIFVHTSGHTGYRGWISFEEGLMVAIPFQNSWVVSPGFEFILTPRLWVRERLHFSIAGTSYEAPFSFETSLMYNFFPFQ